MTAFSMNTPVVPSTLIVKFPVVGPPDGEKVMSANAIFGTRSRTARQRDPRSACRRGITTHVLSVTGTGAGFWAAEPAERGSMPRPALPLKAHSGWAAVPDFRCSPRRCSRRREVLVSNPHGSLPGLVALHAAALHRRVELARVREPQRAGSASPAHQLTAHQLTSSPAHQLTSSPAYNPPS
jgi:hypothetical protein